VTWVCHTCQVADFTQQEEDCLSNGRYCATDPDGLGPLQGKSIVLETLR